ncbi:rRNA-processing protein cgrA, partial [Lachnellula suecica]
HLASMSTEVIEIGQSAAAPQGMRKNGKQWHEPKSAFRPKAGNSTYEKRQVERKAMDAMKAKEKEMKEEKETERQRRITALKEKRAKKEERARYEKLAETMHRKRVERLKRKEKRNKMLKS